MFIVYTEGVYSRSVRLSQAHTHTHVCIIPEGRNGAVQTRIFPPSGTQTPSALTHGRTHSSTNTLKLTR